MDESSAGSFRYIFAFSLVTFALVGAVIAFNAVIDPFAIHRLFTIPGVNVAKPAIHTRVRLYKAYEVARVRPLTLVLGTSRTHVGIRCSHPALAARPGPCYNLAFDGASTREMLAYLVHAQQIRPIELVILGLESYQLSSVPSPVQPDFEPDLLLAPGNPRWRRFIAGDLKLLASFDTLKASVETWRAQRFSEPEWFATDGQRLGEVFFRRPGEEFVRKSPREYFEHYDRREIGWQIEGASGPLSEDAEEVKPAHHEGSLDYVRRIIVFCRAHDIDLRIFITPTHAHQRVIAEATGNARRYDDGKRQLAHLLADEAMRHPPAVPAFDFSGLSTITEEALPPIGTRDEMSFYWDSSHFKDRVGDYVLDRLFAPQGAERAFPSDFGVRIQVDTLDSELREQQRRYDEYRQRFPEDVARLTAEVVRASSRAAADTIVAR